MRVEILNRWTLKAQFTAEIPDDTEPRFRVRAAVQIAYSVGAVLSGAVLSDADLSDADLSGADLSGAVLSDADLRGAVLSDADLRGAVLSDADLSDADLSGADLSGAVLSDADLSGAVLSGAVLSDADLSDADLSGADLSGAVLSDADLRGAVLSDADLSGAVTDVPVATPEQSIENLDRVREIILDDKARLEMRHWHANDEWKDRTCAEEAVCGTTHCLAGWLQVCSTDKAIRGLAPEIAGALLAPVASKMFYRDADEVLGWLEKREYVSEVGK